MPNTFVLIDDSLTMHGLRFSMLGGDMERFKKNPVMLWMHQRGKVVGRWENIRMENGQWLADAVLDTEDPDVAELAGKVERGMIRACSMGVIVHEVEELGGAMIATKWEAYECSLVDVPSNGSALRLYSPEGDEIEFSDFQSTILLTMNDKVNAALLLALAAAVGLSGATATEDAVTERVKALKQERDDLAKQLGDIQKARVATLVADAVKAGKIAATQAPHYETLAGLDFEATQAVLAALPEPQNLLKLTRQGAGTGLDAIVESADDAEKWDKLDKMGRLAELKAADYEAFKRLYKAKHGKEHVA